MAKKKRPTMRELSIKVHQVTKKYRIAQIHNRMEEAKSPTLDANGEVVKSKSKLIMEAFEIALSGLKPHHRAIIYNDFISNNFSFWWENRYTRSTYYRHKYEALVQFVAYFTK